MECLQSPRALLSMSAPSTRRAKGRVETRHIIGSLFVAAGILTAGPAFADDFKSQAAAAAAQWDAAFNAGDAAKLSKGYTREAVILPAGGQQVTGPQGAEQLFGGFIKGGVKNHKITVQGGQSEGDEGFAYGRWQADAGGKPLAGHWVNVLKRENGQWHTALHTWNLDQ
jgi:ketosteroid isomerase-like protein